MLSQLEVAKKVVSEFTSAGSQVNARGKYVVSELEKINSLINRLSQSLTEVRNVVSDPNCSTSQVKIDIIVGSIGSQIKVVRIILSQFS